MFFIVEPFNTSPTTLFPVVTVTPLTPNIGSWTAPGALVAVVTVAMSNGSAFTGTLTFGAPYFDDGGIYAIHGSSSPFYLIVNPSGPGVGAQGGNIDNVTLVATQ